MPRTKTTRTAKKKVATKPRGPSYQAMLETAFVHLGVDQTHSRIALQSYVSNLCEHDGREFQKHHFEHAVNSMIENRVAYVPRHHTRSLTIHKGQRDSLSA